MVSKSFIIWTIISIVLSLLWIVLSYFGWIRHAEMYIRSPTHFIKSYNNLDHATSNSDGDKKATNKVVISFTTTPDRATKLVPLINSLFDQTVKVDKISLNVDEATSKLVPEDIKNYINVYTTSIDYGQANKLIPSLLREKESDTMIIIADDNQIYDKDMIEKLVDASKKSPDNPITTKNESATLVKPIFFSISNSNSISISSSKTVNNQWIASKTNRSVKKTD